MANKSNKHRTSPQRPYRTYDKDELPPSRQRDYRDPKDREYEFDGGDTRREDRDDDRD